MKKNPGRKERRALARSNRIEAHKREIFFLTHPGFGKAKAAIKKRLGLA